jgi:L-threonylcarbamoyladenylate synthase
MKTLYLQASDPQAISQAAALLKQGQLVVFPTDTVYGLAAAVDNAAAIAASTAPKGRPMKKAFPSCYPMLRL